MSTSKKSQIFISNLIWGYSLINTIYCDASTIPPLALGTGFLNLNCLLDQLRKPRTLVKSISVAVCVKSSRENYLMGKTHLSPGEQYKLLSLWKKRKTLLYCKFSCFLDAMTSTTRINQVLANGPNPLNSWARVTFFFSGPCHSNRELPSTSTHWGFLFFL